MHLHSVSFQVARHFSGPLQTVLNRLVKPERHKTLQYAWIGEEKLGEMVGQVFTGKTREMTGKSALPTLMVEPVGGTPATVPK